jgi:hypothetical protein
MSSSEEVRRGVSQADLNASMADVVYWELIAIAILLGLAKKSWWVFGSTYLGLTVCMVIRPLALLLAGLFTLAWGALGWGIGEKLVQKSGAPLVLALLCGVIAAGIHFSAVEWTHDVSS